MQEGHASLLLRRTRKIVNRLSEVSVCLQPLSHEDGPMLLAHTTAIAIFARVFSRYFFCQKREGEQRRKGHMRAVWPSTG